MLVADTSTWIAYLRGEPGGDTDRLDNALADRAVLMAPVVLAELFSARHLRREHAERIQRVPLLEILPGYWQRAGELRAKVLRSGRRARLGDALIAQTSLDHAVPLLTRDRDFEAFARAAGLDALLTTRSQHS